MVRLLSVMLFVALVFAGGALLAPALWWLMQAGAEWSSAGWLRGLADQPFHRYVHRALLALALLGLWPLARALGCRSWREVGLLDPGLGWRRWRLGLGLGAAMFAVTLVAEAALGARVWRAELTPGQVLSSATGAAASALVVGWIEEVMFRGVVCGGLRGVLGWPAAIAVSSLTYAWIHFLGRPAPPEVITWTSGFTAVVQMLRGLLTPLSLLPGFPTLLLAGVLLGWMYRRTGSVFLSVGLHSGWVFWIKMRSVLTCANESPGSLWGESRVSAGWTGLVAVGVAVTVLGCLELSRYRRGSTLDQSDVGG